MPDKKLTEGTTALDYEGTLKNLTKEYYDALDLINRQKAEIERLNFEKASDHEKMQQVLVMLDELKEDIAHDIKLAKAEAYKEFAERLKGTFPQDDFLRSTKRISEDIDNLLKEMVGEDK